MKTLTPIFLTLTLIAITNPAFADWNQMQPAANFNPAVPHMAQQPQAPQVHVQPQHPVGQRRPIEPAHRVQPPVRVNRPVVQQHQVDHHIDRRDIDRRFHDRNYVQYNYTVTTPDANMFGGYESIEVNGQDFLYADGNFFQDVNDQLVNVGPVLGAIVQTIPENYVVVSDEGTNYLFVNGVYFMRVDSGFEVVAGPGSDQG